MNNLLTNGDRFLDLISLNTNEMNKTTPFETSFDTVRKFEHASSFSLTISAVIVFILWLVSLFEIPANIKDYIPVITDILKVISYISMLAYIGLSLISKIIFAGAEKVKREDLIDNSFETVYGNEKSTNYYNNDDVQKGIKRLAFNAHESSFHTENTLRLMLLNKIVRYLFFVTPFILSIFFESGQEVVRLLFEIAIPIEMTVFLITLLRYWIEVRNINERFKIELLNIGGREINESEHPKLILPVLEYYNVKSWASINLDKKIFDEYRDKLSQLWMKRKANYLNQLRGH